MTPYIHLINPSNVCSGFAIMTPRWLAVLAAATPENLQEQLKIHDLAIDSLNWSSINADDLVCISIHTLNARRGYQLMKEIQQRCNAKVLLGGVHVTIRPDEANNQGADSIFIGDGDKVWPEVINDFMQGNLQPLYEGGRVIASDFVKFPQWNLLNHQNYMMATVQTTRGCPESCTFCSVWRTDGREVRFRSIKDTVNEVNYLYKLGFRIIVLADDNFYSVGAKNESSSQAIIAKRLELMRHLELDTPSDIKFLTQTTIRTADDIEFIRAMKRAKIWGVLIGIEAIDSATLASIGKQFNKSENDLVLAIQRLQQNGIYVLGSHIVGLGVDSKETYPRMLEIALESDMALAQFVVYTCFPGTVDYNCILKGKHKLSFKPNHEEYWLSDSSERIPTIHPTLSDSDLKTATALLWNGFYKTRAILNRGWKLGLRSWWLFVYLAFSKFYKRVYFHYGLSADSARIVEVNSVTRWLGRALIQVLKSN